MKKQQTLAYLLPAFFLFLTANISLPAQKTADSLLNALGKSSGETRFKTLKALGKFYKSIDPVKS